MYSIGSKVLERTEGQDANKGRSGGAFAAEGAFTEASDNRYISGCSRRGGCVPLDDTAGRRSPARHIARFSSTSHPDPSHARSPSSPTHSSRTRSSRTYALYRHALHRHALTADTGTRSRLTQVRHMEAHRCPGARSCTCCASVCMRAHRIGTVSHGSSPVYSNCAL